MSDGADDARRSSEPPPPTPTRDGGLERRGQLVVPGLYAWSLTVAPLAWRPGATLVTRAAVGLGLAALVASLVIGGERSDLSRRTALFGLTLASALAFVSAGPSSAPRDPVTGVLGMVGWGVFALVAASPMRWVATGPGDARVTLPSSRPRRGHRDGVALAAAALGALALQWPGWSPVAPERAVLVRVVTLVCACAFVVTVVEIDSATHAERAPRSVSARLGGAVVWLAALLLVLALGGVLAAMR